MDKRAAKILQETFWSPQGWRRESERAVSAEDFEYAKAKGFMFDPVHMDHAQAANAVGGLVDRLDRRTVADAFLSSLSTRRLDWRSAMGSYSVFQHLRPHQPQGTTGRCELCGFYLKGTEQDFNVFNFGRIKWGGVGHEQVAYAAMDLDLFLKNPATAPTSDDISIFRAIVTAIRSAETGVTAATLHAQFPKTLKANKAERDVIISILGFCDVLAGPSHPGFSDTFIPANGRPLPDRRFVDMAYPACWWSGDIGVNEARLEEYFAHVL